MFGGTESETGSSSLSSLMITSRIFNLGIEVIVELVVAATQQPLTRLTRFE